MWCGSCVGEPDGDGGGGDGCVNGLAMGCNGGGGNDDGGGDQAKKWQSCGGGSGTRGCGGDCSGGDRRDCGSNVVVIVVGV